MRSCHGEFNSNPDKLLIEIRSFLEKKQPEIYENIEGLAHPLVSKNLYISKFLDIFLSNKTNEISKFFILKQIFKYYLNLILGLGYECLLILFSPRENISDEKLELCIVTFFNANKFEASIFDDIYFKGLQKKLLDQKKEFIYLPTFYLLSRNPIRAIEQIKIAKEKNKNLISPYGILKKRDCFWLVYYNLKFLISNLRTFNFNDNSHLQKSFNEAMAYKLSNTEVNKFLNYLVAKRLAEKVSKLKVLLWYENLAVDKCIIAGLRKNKNIEILGAQFFLLVNQELNLYPSPYEIKMNLVPDKIFVNQKLPSFVIDPKRYFSGIGMRYEYLNNYIINEEFIKKGEQCSVCLCLYPEKDNFIVQMVQQANLNFNQIYFKKHPGNMATIIPQQNNFLEFKGNQEELLCKSEIIIGADSGIIFEAMALGRQVIIIASDNHASFYVPSYDLKGKLWEIAYSPIELSEKITILQQFRNEHSAELISLSKIIKDQFFIHNNRDILEILELN